MPLPAAVVQADPSLVEHDSGLLEEFAATPWLLPLRTRALNYSGVHELDKLLKLQAAPVANYSAVAVLLFSANIAVMAQNTSEDGAEVCCQKI